VVYFTGGDAMVKKSSTKARQKSSRTNRWYDNHPKLARYLEEFKDMRQKSRDRLVKGVMDIIRDRNPKILEDFLLDFPLDLNRRRWYDSDPYLWLIFNGLAYADADLLSDVTAYLADNATK
jgi:hypothetical protein